MTTVAIDLPDQLAQEAQSAGLLSSGAVEQWLRKQLRTQALGQLQIAVRAMDAADEPPYMSAEEVAKEIATMRAEQRSNGAR